MERAQRMGLFAFLRYEKARKRYEQLLSGLLWLGRKISFGTDRYVVMVDAKGKYNGQKLIEMRMIEGNCNSKITGCVCGLCTMQLQKKEPGIFYMNDLVGLKDLEQYLIKRRTYKLA